MDKLMQMLSTAADGGLIIDEDKHILHWNKAAQEILGYSPKQVIGRPCHEVLRGRDKKGRVICHHRCQVITRALAGKAVANFNTCVNTKSGEMGWINLSTLTYPISKDNSAVVVHLFRDITQEKQYEEFSRRVLEAVNQLQQGSTPFPNVTVLAKDQLAELTEREREVLSHLVRGLSTNDIAQALSISPITARNHLQSILCKLQVHSRVEAVAYAFEHGLVTKE